MSTESFLFYFDLLRHFSEISGEQQLQMIKYSSSGLFIFKNAGTHKRPHLWSSGQSSWLQIRRPGFDSRHYQKKVMGPERGPLSLVSTTEELLDRKVAAPVSKTENTAVGICHADHVAPSVSKTLAMTSPTSGGRSVGIVRSRTQTMEFLFPIKRASQAPCCATQITRCYAW
jgi:hypothetical protein